MQDQNQHLKKKLARLRTLIIGLFDLVSDQLNDAIEAILHSDHGQAKSIRSHDVMVDSMHRKIEYLCETILNEHHAHPADLKMLIATIKINPNLEHIGNEAKNLTEDVLYTSALPTLMQSHLRHMRQEISQVLYNAQLAFVEEDTPQTRMLVDQHKRSSPAVSEAVQLFANPTTGSDSDFQSSVQVFKIIDTLDQINHYTTHIAESIMYWQQGVANRIDTT